MNRRKFLSILAGTAVAVASGMELFKKDIAKKPWCPSQYMGDLRWVYFGNPGGDSWIREAYLDASPYDTGELEKTTTPWRSNVNFRHWNFGEFEKGISCLPTP